MVMIAILLALVVLRTGADLNEKKVLITDESAL
jgi:hypothetical protein